MYYPPDVRATPSTPTGELARLIGFVLVNTTMVGAATWGLCRMLPPLRTEPAGFVLIPMVVIAAVASVILHRVVRRLDSSPARLLALYSTFVASLVVFGVHLSVMQGSGSPEQWARLHQSWWDFVSLMPAALVFGHFFGMPVLVIVGAVDKLMSPVLTPRRRRIPA